MAQCFLFKREMLVWVDETGSDARNQMRKFGYALRESHPLLIGNSLEAKELMQWQQSLVLAC